jgi:hypothetical protein
VNFLVKRLCNTHETHHISPSLTITMTTYIKTDQFQQFPASRYNFPEGRYCKAEDEVYQLIWIRNIGTSKFLPEVWYEDTSMLIFEVERRHSESQGKKNKGHTLAFILYMTEWNGQISTVSVEIPVCYCNISHAYVNVHVVHLKVFWRNRVTSSEPY